MQSIQIKDSWKQAAKDFSLLALTFAVVLGIWWGTAKWIDDTVKSPSSEGESIAQAKGLFGDKYGAVNALFSGLAFAGIIFTILLQRRDLSHTRRAFEEQTSASNQQRFDSTFFKLISLHNEITRNLEELTKKGHRSFSVFNERIKSCDSDFYAFSALSKLTRDQVRAIRDQKSIEKEKYPELNDADVANLIESLSKGVAAFDNHLDSGLDMQERKICSAYKKAAEIHLDNFAHYFRNLYHLLVYIEESTLIKPSEKFRYAKIVRSQLSEDELIALLYNSIAKITLAGRESLELGHPHMGELLAHFDMLKNISLRSLIHPTHLDIFKKNNPGKQNERQRSQA
jgi:Putative phage abortive infection protein